MKFLLTSAGVQNDGIRNTLVNLLGKLVAEIDVLAYAIDDQTAIVVRDGVVEVVSEGSWKRFTP